MEEEQSSLPASSAPKLTVKSITEKMAMLDREVKPLSVVMLYSEAYFLRCFYKSMYYFKEELLLKKWVPTVLKKGHKEINLKVVAC